MTAEQEAASRAVFEESYKTRLWHENHKLDHANTWDSALQHNAEVIKEKDELLRQALEALQGAEGAWIDDVPRDSIDVVITAIQSHLTGEKQ